MKRETLLAPLPAGKLPPWLLRKVLPASVPGSRVLVGPGLGRDAAAIAMGDRVVVAKSDPITFASERGAFHLVEVNANDIACMGATPRWLLVTSLLPLGVTAADILRDFADLREACRHREVELVGGHTEIVPGLSKPILVGTMLGEVSPGELITPGQAAAGDALLLTKGLAIEGTALLASEQAAELEPLIGRDAVEAAATLLHQPGISVVRDAAVARDAGGVTAMHDPTEGGLATAVRELATASSTGATLQASDIPILPETRLVAGALGLDPLGLLASGSLLLAAQPDAVPAILRSLANEGIAASVIGELTDEPGVFTLHVDGVIEPLPEFAVDEVARHFSPAPEGLDNAG